jgi:NAD(P)-dependent dehydrogenase (short-subunit alcohol dehydrogenase family)
MGIQSPGKVTLVHLTRCLAVESGQHGITVNAVAPTFIRTPGTEPALSDPQFRADVIERIAALHRIGKPIEVAGVVVFLASPAASLITGETILVDGDVHVAVQSQDADGQAAERRHDAGRVSCPDQGLVLLVGGPLPPDKSRPGLGLILKEPSAAPYRVA